MNKDKDGILDEEIKKWKVISAIAKFVIFMFSSIFFYLIGSIVWSIVFVQYLQTEPMSTIHMIVMVLIFQIFLGILKLRLQ